MAVTLGHNQYGKAETRLVRASLRADRGGSATRRRAARRAGLGPQPRCSKQAHLPASLRHCWLAVV
jgi:hypothetical protein